MPRAWARLFTLFSIGLGAAALAKTHMLRMSGRATLAGIHGCPTCHGRPAPEWRKPRPHRAAPAALAVSPDGKSLYVALDDTDEVAVIDVASRRVARRAHVGGGPSGLALDAGGLLWVACRAGDRVAVLDPATLGERASVPVGRGPVGIAFVPGAARVVVANSLSNDASVLAGSPPSEVARLETGREPYAVTAASSGTALVVARMAGITRGDEVPRSEVTVVDAAGARVARRVALESAHLSEGVAPLAGSLALAPIVRVRNLVPITQVGQGWVMSSGFARLDAATGEVVELPLDEANGYFADPSGVAVDPAARRAYVASGGGNAVSVVDLAKADAWIAGASGEARRDAIDDLQLSGEYVLARVPTGRNPRAVALSPDGGTLFVAERLEDAVLFVDTKALAAAGRVALGPAPNDPAGRGEAVFARAATTFQSGFSCRSCHPDGHVDGLTYDFDIDGVGRDVLDNRSLQGLSGTDPFKWNGKNATLKVQCGPRFAKVLTRAASFSAPDLADLDAYLLSLPPARPERTGPLTEAQERGKKLFFAKTLPDGRPIPYGKRCSTCHRPPLFTDRIPADVGTRGEHDSTGAFDTPHLLGISTSAPYLHDGRAATLEEIWTVWNPKDTHGLTNSLNKIQLNDLIEYLKTL